jgi:predicted ATP-grasp superfamily ATP-dependent carboligase
VSSVHETDSWDVQEILRICRDEKVDMILPVTENGTAFISRNRPALHGICQVPQLPGPQQLELVQNKLAAHDFFVEHGLATPRTASLTAQLPDGFQPHEEILVKPRTGFGGEGIQRFSDHAKAWKETNGKFQGRELIMQQYIHGSDIDCSVYCEDGRIKAHTIQKRIQYISRDQYKPSRSIEFLSDITVYQLVSKLMSKLRWSGVAHVDLRYNNDTGELLILEVNGRYWTTLLGSEHVGINFPLIHAGLIPTQQIFIGVGRYYSILDLFISPNQVLTNLKDLSVWENLRDPLPKLLGSPGMK